MATKEKFYIGMVARCSTAG